MLFFAIMKILYFLTVAFCFGTLFYDCKKSSNTNNAGSTPVKVYLGDASADYNEINIEVTGVEFLMSGGNTIDLNVHPGKMNLLNYVNGKDSLIASDSIQSGRLSQIRLILGSNNSIKVGETIYPLATPSSQQSGLKLNVDTTLVPGVLYNLVLDFDAGQSIVMTGNGTFQLKPVIRVINNAISGSIAGTVSNTSALPALIKASNAGGTFTTVTDSKGVFLIRGVPAGKYTVTVTPKPGFHETTVNDINVTTGNQTNIGSVNF